MCNDDNPKEDMAAYLRRFAVDGLRIGHSPSDVLVRIVDSVAGVVQGRGAIVLPSFRPW